jgi:hypothetical protein
MKRDLVYFGAGVMQGLSVCGMAFAVYYCAHRGYRDAAAGMCVYLFLTESQNLRESIRDAKVKA